MDNPPILLSSPSFLAREELEQPSIDPDFNIQTMFRPNEQISLIEIKKTPQTAYFPFNIKEPIFLKANPDQKTPYKNRQMIEILNLMLRFQPEAIRNAFEDNQ